jgi:hypothetical protein
MNLVKGGQRLHHGVNIFQHPIYVEILLKDGDIIHHILGFPSGLLSCLLGRLNIAHDAPSAAGHWQIPFRHTL